MNEDNWYNAKYINQIELAFSLFPELALDSAQFLVILAILWLQKNEENITVDNIIKYSKLTKEKINDILPQLQKKGFLLIKTKKNKVEFDMKGLFTERANKILALDVSLFDLFEQEFGRVLTQNELEILVDLQKRYDRAELTEAMRKAKLYEKTNMNYVAKILSNLKKSDE